MSLESIAMARLEFATRDMVECAAHGGAPDALFELGLMYCAGRDVDLDLVTAHKWFNLAALRGNHEAKRYRLEIAQEMSRVEIARAQRLAREWLAKH
jgi:TPR repeat protein